MAWLGWAAAALRNGARDQYIGWDREQKARRLHLVPAHIGRTRLLRVASYQIHPHEATPSPSFMPNAPFRTLT